MTNNEQSTPEAPESEGAVEGVVETATNNDTASADVPSHGELILLLEDARSKADEHWDQVLRSNAELENLRRRAKQDVENAHRYALEKFTQELLPVKDSLEMGLAAASGETDAAEAIKQLREGTELTLKMLSAAMEKSGIKEIDPAGDTFNPEQHQAMSMQESEEYAPNTVMAVMQKGYQLNERLIRPAMVVVSKAKA
ncbi:MAG TPA: nucleotide exchange factor GrpE [Gammaproteobacteria bacterium]|nr:nucleotide exchange factor GrpE [Gammaproteobacteria bacterium]